MLIYIVCNLLLTLIEFNASVLSQQVEHSSAATTTNCVSRASLQLLTSLSLLPILLLPSASFDAPNRRAPILATFLVALSLLVDAILKLLPCFQALIYASQPDIVNNAPVFIALHLLLHSVWLAFTHRRPGHESRTIEARMLVDDLVIPTDLATDATVRVLRLHATTFVLLRVTVVSTRLLLPVWNRLSVLIVTAVILGCAKYTWPILMDAVYVLLQAAPLDSVQSIRSRRQSVLALDGVVECSNVHIWEESHGLIVGTLSVYAHPSACKYTVLRRSIAAFDGLVDDLTVQVDSWRAT